MKALPAQLTSEQPQKDQGKPSVRAERDRIIDALKAHGTLSPASLANLTGISRSVVDRILREEKKKRITERDWDGRGWVHFMADPAQSVLKRRHRTVLRIAITRGYASNRRLREALPLGRTAVGNILRKMVRDGYLRSTGRASGTRYVAEPKAISGFLPLLNLHEESDKTLLPRKMAFAHAISTIIDKRKIDSRDTAPLGNHLGMSMYIL